MKDRKNQCESVDPVVLQMLMVHVFQAKAWAEWVNKYGPKGDLKKRLSEVRGAITRLSHVLKGSEKIFDHSITISDSLMRMAMLTDEQKDELTEKLDSLLSEYEKINA